MIPAKNATPVYIAADVVLTLVPDATTVIVARDDPPTESFTQRWTGYVPGAE